MIFDAVRRADRNNVGICFDIGHYLYYRKKNFPDEPVILPGKEFFSRVVHTHIHAINGLTTHFPLGRYELPLDEMIYALYMHYYGVYNLELDFPRLKEDFELLPTLLESVDCLESAMPHAARLFDDIRSGFDNKFHNALTVFNEKEGSYLGLIHSTSYLFNTNGYRWAMDIAFRNANELARSPSRIAELFENVALMVITHEHRDHYEELTIKRLANNDMKWIVPDFLYDRTVSLGVSPNRIIIAHDGDTLSVGPLNIRVFKSLHFRPDTGKGVDEYGYHISASGAPSMVFPCDIRDFSVEKLSDIPTADYCFAHVWLGDNNSFAKDYGELPDRFARFMLHFSKKNIVLAHLYENGRRDAYMWRSEHAELISRKIKEISPETRVYIPVAGEVLRLG